MATGVVRCIFQRHR